MTDQEKLTNEALGIHLKYIREELTEIRATLVQFKDNYVTKQEFAPVKMTVYGFVGLVLTGVIGALIMVVLR